MCSSGVWEWLLDVYAVLVECTSGSNPTTHLQMARHATLLVQCRLHYLYRSSAVGRGHFGPGCCRPLGDSACAANCGAECLVQSSPCCAAIARIAKYASRGDMLWSRITFAIES